DAALAGAAAAHLDALGVRHRDGFGALLERAGPVDGDRPLSRRSAAVIDGPAVERLAGPVDLALLVMRLEPDRVRRPGEDLVDEDLVAHVLEAEGAGGGPAVDRLADLLLAERGRAGWSAHAHPRNFAFGRASCIAT